jgi:hypothetical protein
MKDEDDASQDLLTHVSNFDTKLYLFILLDQMAQMILFK